MRTRAFYSFIFVALFVATGCLAEGDPDSTHFGDYWFAGLAELDRYELRQSRYGELHDGNAVLVFVTEDFLPGRQVKTDSSDREASGAWPVMKMNLTKSFTTGIYPYSVMTSVFTPLDQAVHPKTLKATTTVQEWCGQQFTQINLRDERYQVRSFSYFESQGDQESDVGQAVLEDGIWTRIRIDPTSLPVGEFRMVPGGEHRRMRHRSATPQPVQARLGEVVDGTRTYRIHYLQTDRVLEIEFEAQIPHRIEGWRETDHVGGNDSPLLTTTARRTHTVRSDYWNHRGRDDLPLRRKLGL
jgi:hypothetical protein